MIVIAMIFLGFLLIAGGVVLLWSSYSYYKAAKSLLDFSEKQNKALLDQEKDFKEYRDYKKNVGL